MQGAAGSHLETCRSHLETCTAPGPAPGHGNLRNWQMSKKGEGCKHWWLLVGDQSEGAMCTCQCCDA